MKRNLLHNAHCHANAPLKREIKCSGPCCSACFVKTQFAYTFVTCTLPSFVILCFETRSQENVSRKRLGANACPLCFYFRDVCSLIRTVIMKIENNAFDLCSQLNITSSLYASSDFVTGVIIYTGST